MTPMDDHVVVRDVGPRDGLQSASAKLSAATKSRLVSSLAAAGLPRIEAGSFVSPRAVPQMADSREVFSTVGRPPGTILEALVLDERGAHQALEAGAQTLVTVVAASDTFSRKNARRSTEEAIETAARVRTVAGEAGIPCVLDIATSFGCAFEGVVPVERVAAVAEAALGLGFEEITLADTTGMATPSAVRSVLTAVGAVPGNGVLWGLHFHNTRGLGLVNVMAGLEGGIRFFDASVGGIGGCPFSPGATGNICTEDLVFLLDSLGLSTGIALDALVDTALALEADLGSTLPGQVMRTRVARAAAA